MRFLVTGASGQLGYDVIRQLHERGFTDVIGLNSSDMNITNQEKVNQTIHMYRPDVIIHCAAWTAVDKAEDETDKCYDVNVNGTKYISEVAKAIDAKLIYISTDYVFDGNKDGLYEANDKPKPQNIYGKTKYLGEVEALKNPKTFVVRISWVFGLNGNNFVKTMLKLAETRKELNIVSDQVGSPTYTVDLAKLLVDMSLSEKYGIYHATNEGYCTWNEFATKIFELNDIEMIVNPILTKDYPVKAKRPLNSKLNKSNLVENGFNLLPTWEDALIRYNNELQKLNKININTKILITGGAGFIGGNFVHYILDKYPNYDVVCLDALTYAGNLATLKDVMDNPKFKFVQGDISDREFVFKLFEEEQFDIVVNFAAESHVDRSIENPGLFLQTNVIGTATLMDASRKFSVKRYHQVSTDEVYGDLPLDQPDLMFTENTPIHTSSPYSASKAAADLLVQAYMRTFGFPATISRCSNNYGPYHFPEKLIPLMISRALNDEALPVYGNGANVRDWLHVYDHCTAIDLIIHNGKVGEVYNIGGHNERTNLEVVKAILMLLEKPDSLINYVTDRAGHDMRYAIDPSKIHNELGWTHKYSFETGLMYTIKWYLENREWWENIINGEYKTYYKKMYDNK